MALAPSNLDCFVTFHSFSWSFKGLFGDYFGLCPQWAKIVNKCAKYQLKLLEGQRYFEKENLVNTKCIVGCCVVVQAKGTSP